LDILYNVDDPTSEKLLAEVAAMDAAKVIAVAKKYLKNPLAVVVTSQPIDEQELEAAVQGK